MSDIWDAPNPWANGAPDNEPRPEDDPVEIVCDGRRCGGHPHE